MRSSLPHQQIQPSSSINTEPGPTLARGTRSRFRRMLGAMLNSELGAQLRLAFDDDRDADTFLMRLDRYGPELVASLRAVYGDRTDALLDTLIPVLLHAFHTRPA